MARKSTKLDRATLLRKGGSAALFTLLAASAGGANADAQEKFCCSPGDFGWDPDEATRQADGFKTARGLRVIGRNPGTKPPPAKLEGGWMALFFIPNANGFGRDSYGNRNVTKNRDLYFYSKY